MHAVLDVVDRVGDVVGPVHHLRLEAAAPVVPAGAQPVEGGAVGGVAAELAALGRARPRVLAGGVEHGAGQVEPGRLARRPQRLGLEPGQHPQGLGVALEPAAVAGPRRRARSRRCARTAGARCRGPGRRRRRRRRRSPARRRSRGRSARPRASGSAGCAGSRPRPAPRPASCRPAGGTRRSAAPGRGRGRSRRGAPRRPGRRRAWAARRRTVRARPARRRRSAHRTRGGRYSCSSIQSEKRSNVSTHMPTAYFSCARVAPASKS